MKRRKKKTVLIVILSIIVIFLAYILISLWVSVNLIVTREYSIDTRSTGERMNVMQQMKDYYNGGGHVLAAGGTMPKEVFDWYMEKVVGEFDPAIL